MLNYFVPCIEGQAVTMLRDAGENIDWHRVQRDKPGAPPIMAAKMPLEPADQPEWDYHRWVLGMSSWHVYFDEYGRPCLFQDPACMPTPPEHQAGSPKIYSTRESLKIQPMHDERFSFSLADLVGGDQWDTTASPPLRQPYPNRTHD